MTALSRSTISHYDHYNRVWLPQPIAADALEPIIALWPSQQVGPIRLPKSRFFASSPSSNIPVAYLDISEHHIVNPTINTINKASLV